MYDTQISMGYCIPTKEDSLEAYAMIQEEIEKQSGMGGPIYRLTTSKLGSYCHNGFRLYLGGRRARKNLPALPIPQKEGLERCGNTSF